MNSDIGFDDPTIGFDGLVPTTGVMGSTVMAGTPSRAAAMTGGPRGETTVTTTRSRPEVHGG